MTQSQHAGNSGGCGRFGQMDEQTVFCGKIPRTRRRKQTQSYLVFSARDRSAKSERNPVCVYILYVYTYYIYIYNWVDCPTYYCSMFLLAQLGVGASLLFRDFAATTCCFFSKRAGVGVCKYAQFKDSMCSIMLSHHHNSLLCWYWRGGKGTPTLTLG